LIAFFDESGHSSATEFFSLAAFVADDTDWAAFDHLWQDALHDAQAPYLHMKEFAHCVGPFQGWTEEQRRALLGGCVNALNSIPAIAVGAALSMADFNALDSEARSALRNPFFCCFQEVVRGVTLSALFEPADTRVRMVFSRQDEFGGLAKQLWSVMAEMIDVGPLMGSLEFANMRDVAALQAADLLAYELRHHYHLRKTRPGSASRWAFREIVHHQRVAHSARRLKYLPAWYLKAQAEGTFGSLMEMMLSDPWTHDQKWKEMIPEIA
jgi:Protein of unknown function (DUF3800)